MDRRRLLALAAALPLVPRPAVAFIGRAPVRGTILSVEGRTLMLAGTEGAVRATLAPGARIIAERRLEQPEEVSPGRLIYVADADDGAAATLSFASMIYILEESSTREEGAHYIDTYFAVTGRTAAVTRLGPPSFAITVNGAPRRVKVAFFTMIFRHEDGDESLLVPGTVVSFSVFNTQDEPNAWTVDELVVHLQGRD